MILDLSLTDSTLYNEHEWLVHDDLCESEHFHTILKTLNPGDDPPLSRRNFARADWSLYQTVC